MDDPCRPDIQQSITNITLSAGFITKPIINPYVFFICSNLQITKGIHTDKIWRHLVNRVLSGI